MSLIIHGGGGGGGSGGGDDGDGDGDAMTPSTTHHRSRFQILDRLHLNRLGWGYIWALHSRDYNAINTSNGQLNQ